MLIFETWTRGSMAQRIAIFNRSTIMNPRVNDVGIFDYLFVVSLVISLISIAIRGSGRIRYNDIILNK